ncbi:MAG: hypothetical protein ACREBN_02900 [Burkholderiaceae bacterium]
MKSTELSKSAAAIIACIALTALAGCGADRSGSSAESLAEANADTQSAALTSYAVPAIEVEDVRNYHLGIHG